MINSAPGYGSLVEWQTVLSIDDLQDAEDALDAIAEVSGPPPGAKP